MARHSTPRPLLWTLALCATASTVLAQGPAPPAPAVPADTTARRSAVADSARPAPPPSPIASLRNKISAGDLPSAESILEVYREKHGEDTRYCYGLSWLARGALLLGDVDKAHRYAEDVRRRCAAAIAAGTRLDQEDNLELAFGAAVEVEAQLIQRQRGAAAAAERLRAEIAKLEGPVALRSRLYKRLNLLTLTGTRAPELEIEEWIGKRPPTLASLLGKPVLLFIWAEYCGDCRAQAAALARTRERHAADGLQIVALTRYFEKPERRAAEKARADSAWKADYAGVGAIPIVVSTASMERYGGSSTPTFVFVDRQGVVRDYTPTRLTDAEFERRLAPILR